MLIIISKSLKKNSKKADAILSRYAWKISTGVWVWQKASLRFYIINELKRQNIESSVLFIWHDRSSQTGFDFLLSGSTPDDPINDKGIKIDKFKR